MIQKTIIKTRDTIQQKTEAHSLYFLNLEMCLIAQFENCLEMGTEKTLLGSNFEKYENSIYVWQNLNFKKCKSDIKKDSIIVHGKNVSSNFQKT